MKEENISKERDTKVRIFSGALKVSSTMVYRSFGKKTKYVVIHASRSDVARSATTDILDKVLQLKKNIKNKLIDADVILSTPTLRTENEKALLILRQLIKYLLNLLYI